ncbi:maleylpyruvate isomerase N-terminal domain-containing protein [Embleya sp. NPDC059259]|uniref:maleylpyruvate isomerase N-terminal domain-containing protein n=1 Tax=unclassified Embleya TaxID=2699296 RepID=UPI00368D1F6D
MTGAGRLRPRRPPPIGPLPRRRSHRIAHPGIRLRRHHMPFRNRGRHPAHPTADPSPAPLASRVPPTSDADAGRASRRNRAPCRDNHAMDAKTLSVVTETCRTALEGQVGRDWDRPVPGMTWTVAQAVAHVGDTLLWYATDLAGGARELSTMDLGVRPATPPADLVRTLDTFATVLGRVIEGSTADARGFHPFGAADASGFAAMACDEMLVHTYDALRGLEVEFTPAGDLARATAARLFPWAPAHPDPWETLLWANGRRDLPGCARQTGWRWHCAPLDEWDGTIPHDPPRPETRSA